MQELNDVDKAICYSNILYNIKFLEAKYIEEVTQDAMKYYV